MGLSKGNYAKVVMLVMGVGCFGTDFNPVLEELLKTNLDGRWTYMRA